jgi:uncharacterized repeat protein (TIGR01451 family)
MTVKTVMLVVLGLLAGLVCAASASAAVPAGGLTVDSFAQPTNFTVSEGGAYEIVVRNAGSVASDGSEIVITDELPAGLTAQSIGFTLTPAGEGQLINLAGFFPCGGSPAVCRFPVPLGPDETLTMTVQVAVAQGTPEQRVNKVRVSGGGAPGVSVEQPNKVSSSPASFGLSNFGLYIAGVDGARDTQAGDHPYEFTATFGFNNAMRTVGPQGEPADTSVQDVKDVVVDLPVGFVGSTLATPKCTFTQLSSLHHCPTDTVVGHIATQPGGQTSVDSPLYNLVPEQGVPAEFAYFDVLGASHVFYTRVVPSAAGYVLQTTVPDIPSVDLTNSIVTFYGDPAAKQEELARLEGQVASPIPHVPFFTNPTDCSGGPVTGSVYVDSWQNPGGWTAEGTPDVGDGKWVSATSVAPPVTGCDALQFPAELGAQPTTHEADKPSGMDLEIKVPQSETMGAPGTPTLDKAVVRFPEGFTVDPSAGDGLAACSEAQIGWLGGTDLNFNAAEPECPEASKIGALELETPLVAHKFEGEMYLASQNENPYHATIGLYVVVQDPITGVLVKIAGTATANPRTGQLTGTFEENPNLPFSDLKLHFFGGPRAEFATPESCGMFTTSTELFPYSAPGSGPPSTPFDSFVINEACPTGGFAPSFSASSLDLQAGAYTPFVVSFSRSDADQELAGLTVALPPGLIGKIAGVPLCTDTEIQEARTGTGGCPEASLVGTVKAGAGPGPDPLFVSGKAYLTGPYNGGPYGLAVVVPAVAGPFNFGTVVVRQSLRIDPHTAQVTAVSDAFPTIIDGIPLRLRRIDVTLNRPEFTFNPTSCEHETFAGSISGSPLGAPRTLAGTVGYASEPGASSAFTTPFQVTDCSTLAFKPSFTVSTPAQASKSNGAALTFKIAYPKGAMGAQAWFNEAKFDIPKQLSARLSTLQRACLAATFENNRGACPAASIIGHATVHTEVLPEALQGPVYFVSYGSAKFPDAVMVLHGSNVTIELHGNTFINNKTGITSATFRALPDVPFESIEVNLPQGPFSEFGTNLPAKAKYSFCGQNLNMPTFFKASNGLEIKQNTPLQITGCNKPKKQTRAQKLAAALKACHKQPRGHRAACALNAHRKYTIERQSNK